MCSGPCDAPFEVLFAVPVGEHGIGYANVDEVEVEAFGPSSLAVAPEGDVWIADVVNSRLHRYGLDGTHLASLSLVDFEIASPADLAAGPDGLLILDVYPATSRYRVVHLDRSGAMQAAIALPEGLWLEDGLTGIAWDSRGDIWVELEFGNRVATLDLSGSEPSFEETVGYPYSTGTFSQQPDDPFAFRAGFHSVAIASTAEWGGLTLIGVNPDGSFVLQLDEVYQDEDGAFIVVESVHLYDHEGEHMGSAPFPLDSQLIPVEHALTLGPDGYAYGMITDTASVKVVRLNYGR